MCHICLKLAYIISSHVLKKISIHRGPTPSQICVLEGLHIAVCLPLGKLKVLSESARQA
jgi:hypothetical protein